MSINSPAATEANTVWALKYIEKNVKISMELDCNALKGKIRLAGGQGFVYIHLPTCLVLWL